MLSPELLASMKEAASLADERGLVRLDGNKLVVDQAALQTWFLNNRGDPVLSRVVDQYHEGPDFQVLRESHIFGPAGQSWLTSPLTIIPSLLGQCLTAPVFERPIERYKELLTSDAATARLVVPLKGVTPLNACDLVEGVRLVPFAEIPDCPQKRFFSGDDSSLGFAVLVVGAPTAALVMEFEHSPLLIRKDRLAAERDKLRAEYDRHVERLRCLDDARRCVSLIGPNPATHVGSWYMLADPELTELGISGSGMNFDLLASGGDSLGEFDPTEAARLTERFLSLPEGFREQLRRPIDRLVQAMREPALEDRAIDLGVCLESVLMHATGKQNDNVSIRFRLALRGAFFLENDPARRHERFKLLRRIYDLRSTAVHSGRVTSEPKRAKEDSAVKQATEYSAISGLLNSGLFTAASILRSIIERGTWPDWEKEFVFGIPPSQE